MADLFWSSSTPGTNRLAIYESNPSSISRCVQLKTIGLYGNLVMEEHASTTEGHTSAYQDVQARLAQAKTEGPLPRVFGLHALELCLQATKSLVTPGKILPSCRSWLTASVSVTRNCSPLCSNWWSGPAVLPNALGVQRLPHSEPRVSVKSTCRE